MYGTVFKYRYLCAFDELTVACDLNAFSCPYKTFTLGDVDLVSASLCRYINLELTVFLTEDRHAVHVICRELNAEALEEAEQEPC